MTMCYVTLKQREVIRGTPLEEVAVEESESAAAGTRGGNILVEEESRRPAGGFVVA